MDIRDYLPPNLKHVMAYTSQAEREKRKQAARDRFGRPTPVPVGEARGAEEAAPVDVAEEARPPVSRQVARPARGIRLTLAQVAVAMLCVVVVIAVAAVMPVVARWSRRTSGGASMMVPSGSVTVPSASLAPTPVVSATAPSTTAIPSALQLASAQVSALPEAPRRDPPRTEPRRRRVPRVDAGAPASDEPVLTE